MSKIIKTKVSLITSKNNGMKGSTRNLSDNFFTSKLNLSQDIAATEDWAVNLSIWCASRTDTFSLFLFLLDDIKLFEHIFNGIGSFLKARVCTISP